MSRRAILVLIDQASRDGFTQRLVARYLERKGARVILCNQGTLRALCERHRPHTVFASWLVGGALMDYLLEIRNAVHIVLVDQEGGKLGENSFKRSFTRLGGVKARIAQACTRVLMWGETQARWLRDLGLLTADRIVVTGSPRLDPYMVPAPASGADRYIGVTLRGDVITAQPDRFMENVYQFAQLDPKDGVSVGYAAHLQFEDRLWHITAGARHMFTLLNALARRTEARIVVRPGPWELPSVYHFLSRRVPRLSVEPRMTQPGYVRGAFVVLDEASSLGLEALIAGVPVVTTQGFIPRLAEHVGTGGLYDAPYVKAYWTPASVEEAVDLVLKAERGQLGATHAPELLASYLADYHRWPRRRPGSFAMADALLEVLDLPAKGALPPAAAIRSRRDRLKRLAHRYVPGAVAATKAKLFWQCVAGPERELFRRYHHFPMLYPHGREGAETFAALLRVVGEAP